MKAADALANARSIVADLRRTGPEVWQRFHAGAVDQLWYYRSLAVILVGAPPGRAQRRAARRGHRDGSSCPGGGSTWATRNRARTEPAPIRSGRSDLGVSAAVAAASGSHTSAAAWRRASRCSALTGAGGPSAGRAGSEYALVGQALPLRVGETGAEAASSGAAPSWRSWRRGHTPRRFPELSALFAA